MFSFAKVNLDIRNLKRNSLIGLCCDEQVLVFRVCFLHFLFKRRHNAKFGLCFIRNLRVENFKKQRLLFSVGIVLLQHLVARLTDLLHFRFKSLELGLNWVYGISLFSELSSVKVCLMFLARCVCQVRIFSRV